MKSLCNSCRKTWTHSEDFKCGLTKHLYGQQGKGVESCSRYDNMVIIETEDDGTKRCGLCGKLWTGWDVCPSCGADFRRSSYVGDKK